MTVELQMRGAAFDGAAFEDGLFGKACVAGWFRYEQDPRRRPLIDRLQAVKMV